MSYSSAVGVKALLTCSTRERAARVSFGKKLKGGGHPYLQSNGESKQ
jgi:hypothetical protein